MKVVGRGASRTLSPNASGTLRALCNTGETPAGGGFSSSRGVRILRSAKGSSPSGDFWQVDFHNDTGSAVTVYADAMCVPE